jgi:hypothetical protein
VKNKRLLIFLSCIFALIVLIIIVGRSIQTASFDDQVRQVLSGSGPSKKIFTGKDLAGLPEPVQRYFRNVLKENQPYIGTARLKHEGQFKTGLDKAWIPIKGEQYFATVKPAYIWKGKTFLFTARDMYIADKGQLTVSLFSLVNIVNADGDSYNEGELQRWLAESVWFPTNLLPSERLKWLPVDENNAKLLFNYLGLSLDFLVNFNDTGEITQMITKRYMNEGKKETWIVKMKDYKVLNGIRVPTRAEAIRRAVSLACL